MPTHLYCLLPSASRAAPPAGVRVVDARVGMAWAGETGEVRVSRDARDAAKATIAHDRVIGSALAQGVTPLPAALADPYDDEAAMIADVAAHAQLLDPAFKAIDGMVEMTTIVALRDALPAASVPGRGTAYLEQLRSASDRVAAIADRLANSLGKHFVDSRRRGDGGKAAISHMIPRTAIELYRSQALALAGSGYRIVIDGPRAPYSFVLYAPRRGLITELRLGGTILAT